MKTCVDAGTPDSDNRGHSEIGARQANMSNPSQSRSRSRLPKESIVFEKIVPAALIVLGIVAAVLILFALGVLLGLVHF